MGDWDALILKALNKEPRKRFQSITEMKREIEALGTRPSAGSSRISPKAVVHGRGRRGADGRPCGLALRVCGCGGRANGSTLSSYIFGCCRPGAP